MTNIPENPVIRGAKVWLRPMSLDDADLYSKATQDRDLAHYTLFDKPETEDFSRQHFETTLNDYGKSAYWFAICELGSAKSVGLIVLHSFDNRNGSADFGIFIYDPLTRGEGYGSDAINALLDFGFGELPLERIALTVVAYNKRAFALYKKLGFVHEGTLRNAYRHRGTLHNIHVMAMLREEWDTLSRPKSWDY